jgi:hypothetical protein
MDNTINFDAASAAWRKNKTFTKSKYCIYLCKYPNCTNGRMMNKKYHYEYNYKIYNDYCNNHQEKLIG